MPQTITVENAGTGSLTYNNTTSTTSGGPWLKVSSTSGSTNATAAGTVTVSVNIAGLQVGDYYGEIVVSPSDAGISPQIATVALHVVSPADSPGGSVGSFGLIFVTNAGGANPAAQMLMVTNPSPDPLSFLVSPFSNASASWLTATPLSGTVSAGNPATLSVQPVLGALTPGVYIGDLTITLIPANATAATVAQVLHVQVIFVVLPAGVPVPAIQTRAEPRVTTCTPAMLVPVFTLLGVGFNATAGWPSAIEVAVVDDCGNPLNSGTVTVTFSSGDPALSLLSIGSGRWTGTWNAVNASSDVTLTADAEEVQPRLSGHASIGGALESNSAVPSISTGGVVSAANFAANQPLAPGSFGAIFGANLATGLEGSKGFPLNTQLGDTLVALGSQEIPLLFTSTGQINGVVPYNVPVNTTQQMIVQRGNTLSIPQPVAIAAALPAVFTQNGAGTGAALINVFKSDGTPLPNNSAVSAGDVIVFYCSGLGAVDHPVSAGAQTPLTPLSNTINPVTVTIGGKQQKAAFAGLTPLFAQLYQVNVVMPSGVPAGTADVTLSAAGQDSEPVTIQVH
jgi:uncharacterized protein (TIGR03437 family)